MSGERRCDGLGFWQVQTREGFYPFGLLATRPKQTGDWDQRRVGDNSAHRLMSLDAMPLSEEYS
jgi:hypothetical protein